MTAINEARLHASKILVVDDIDVNLKMIEHSLRGYGYKNILCAKDGREALHMTQQHRPDIVILDLMMPNMDGFEYCEAIRTDEHYDTMPILVQTALDDVTQKVRAFKLGATDYVCKPIDPGEISARTKVHLTQKLLMQDLKEYHQRTSAELLAARRMQDRILPSSHQVNLCERLFDLEMASHFETCSTMGGDCWGIYPLSDRLLGMYIFDFSGRGVASAINVFRMHTYIQEYIPASSEPGYFLSSLNRHLHPLLSREELATMFYGIIDIEANCLLYSSAGSPSPLLYSKEGEAQFLPSAGVPLGIDSGTLYETQYVPFTAGDLLLLYSDCLVETRNHQEQFIVESDIQNAVRDKLKTQNTNRAQLAVEAADTLLKTHSPEPLRDDHTLAALWRRG